MEKKIKWKPYIVAGITSLLFGIFIFCLFAFILKKPLMDGSSFAAIILLSFSALMWVAREGFFDIFSYGFRQMAHMMYSKKANEINDYSGYKEYKNEVREKRAKTFLAVGATGLFFLLVTLIIFLVTL